MTCEAFIKACAGAAFDARFNVTKPEDWMGILNFQGGELFPEIGYRGQTSVAVSTITAGPLQVDLSAETSLFDIKEIYVIDTLGKKFPYDEWIFGKEDKVLDLDPSTSKDRTKFFDQYTTLQINWYGYFPTFVKFSDIINLPAPHLVLLQKICIRESLRRVLMDHTKLDRFRTLVSKINEYALIAIIRDYTTDIEISKRRIRDTGQVRTF